MIRGCIVTLILAFGIFISSPCCPTDSSDEQSIYVAEGRISAIDTFKSTVTVKSLIAYPIIKYNEVTLFVGPDTKIIYKGGAMSIFDFVMGNLVNAKYAGKDDILEALLITIIK